VDALPDAKTLRDLSGKVDALPDAKTLSDLSGKVDALPDAKVLSDLVVEAESHRPWLNTIIAFLKILGVMLATAAAGGVLWLVAKSILGTLGG
jgi:hypothetical protein